MKLSKLILLVYLSLLVLLFQNCSQPNILIKDEIIKTESKGSFCVDPPVIAAQGLTKILFVIDVSRSNGDYDPGCTKRCSALRTFAEQTKNTKGLEWGIMTFTDGTQIYTVDEDGNEGFTNNFDSFNLAIDEVEKRNQVNGTNYLPALDRVKSIIQIDQENETQERVKYVVAFLSDGEPTDNGENVNIDHLIRPKVENIMDIVPGQITLSTGYYGENNKNAENTLIMMKDIGNGIFNHYGESNEIDLNKLIPIDNKEPWALKQFLIYNLSSTVCLDQTVDADSDGDGLCDKDEEKLSGFSPTNRFSFGDGYGDYFYWRKLTYGEALPHCTDTTDKDFDLLTACEEYILYNSSALNLPSSYADPLNPDTDLDGFLDIIEVYNFKTSKAAAIDMFNLYKNFDDDIDNARQQIIQGRNPLENDEDKPKQIVRVNTLPINSSGQNCYEIESGELLAYKTKAFFGSDNVKLNHMKNENVFLIYYIQVPQSDPYSKGILKHSIQKVLVDEDDGIRLTIDPNEINFSNTAFETYVVPE